jgi:phosphatidylserine/phosphatidylglycerophosphate/cardiolipin synthase-like enzyme
MRKVSTETGPFRARAISGTHVVLMAWDVDTDKRAGLLGFAIQRRVGSGAATFLKGTKYFSSLVPHPDKEATYSSEQQPFQTFLWSDYECDPKTQYTFELFALYGTPEALEKRYKCSVTISTEAEDDGRHGVWFNRGAVASHALAVQFKNRQVTDAIANQVDAQGLISDTEAKWLSRGLAEACIRYINDIPAGDGLRVCAYEFTYPPILNALKRALDRGVDVRIVYHFTKKSNDPNLKAVQAAKLPTNSQVAGAATQILFQRTRTQIPHNKFIVHLRGGKPTRVWTGSTNFTSTGFLGQTNVGHLVTDKTVAATYLKYWEELSADPVHSAAVVEAVRLTPNPPNAIPATSIAMFYSPRLAQNMLNWYADRIGDAASLAMMTIPFNVAPEILTGLSKKRDSMRLVILENPPTPEVLAAQKANQGKLLFSNGALLGKQFLRNPQGGGKVIPIPQSPVDQWFIDEELARPINNGHVYFMHAKTLLIDPLSADPLVCSGSANFSKNSLIANDENMLLIRGETRVADIYLTEFDRIFRHFYARDAINRIAESGGKDNPLPLDETGKWVADYFTGYKNNRQQLFFPAGAAPPAWTIQASKDADEFLNEQDVAKSNRKKKSSSPTALKKTPTKKK